MAIHSDAPIISTGKQLTEQEAQSLGLPISNTASPSEQYAQQAELEYQQSLAQLERDTSKDTVWGYTGAPVTEGVTRGFGEILQTTDDIGTSLFGEDSFMNQPLWGTKDEMAQDTLRSEADRIQREQVANSAVADFIGDTAQFATGYATSPVRAAGLGSTLAKGAMSDAVAFNPDEALLSDMATNIDDPWLRRGARAVEGASLGLAGEGVMRGLRRSSLPVRDASPESLAAYEQSPIGQAQSTNTEELLRVNTAREKLAGADEILNRLRGRQSDEPIKPTPIDYREQLVINDWQEANQTVARRNVDEYGQPLDRALVDNWEGDWYLDRGSNFWYPKPKKQDLSDLRQLIYREAMDSADSLSSQSIMNLSMGSRVKQPRTSEDPFAKRVERALTHRRDGSPRIAPSLTGLNPQMREAIELGTGQLRLLQALEYAERAFPADAVNWVRGRNLDKTINTNKNEVIERINNELDRLEADDWSSTFGRDSKRLHKALTNIKHKFENNQALDAADTDALKAGGARIGGISSMRTSSSGELIGDYEATSIANRVMGHSRLLSGLQGSQGVSKLAQGASLILPFMTGGVSVPVSAISSVVKSSMENKLYSKVRDSASYGKYLFKERQADEWAKNGVISAQEHGQYLNDAHETLQEELLEEEVRTGFLKDIVIETLNELPIIVQSVEAASRAQIAQEDSDEVL